MRREQAQRALARRRHERSLRRTESPDRAGLISLDSSRRFFKLFNIGLYSGIRINLRGREPRGPSRAGRESSRRSWSGCCTDLLDVVDADTGHPLIVRVLRTRDLYRGERLDDLPDLLVEWDPRRVQAIRHLGPDRNGAP